MIGRHSPHRTHPCLSRRAFLKAAGGAAAGLALASCQSEPELPAPTAPVAIFRATSYNRLVVRRQTEAAFDMLGGLGDVIPPGASVAIKVNLTGGMANRPLHNVPRVESYWTHPEVVRALGELLRDAGASKLYIVEGVYDTQSYTEAGLVDVAKALDATLVDLNQPAPYTDFFTASVGEGWFAYADFPFNPVLDNVDAFVSVPKMKCHNTAGITSAMKNLVGIGPLGKFLITPGDVYRGAFHFGPRGTEDVKHRLPRVILDLNRARPIQLSLVDGIVTTDGGEGPWVPGTHLQKPGVLIAGKNPVTIDAVATAVMGFDPTAEYPHTPFVHGENHLNIARKLGLGTNWLEEIEVRGATIAEVQQDFAPSTA